MRDTSPWCVECEKEGVLMPFDEVDHVIALENGGEDTDENRQGLCLMHHQRKTRLDNGYQPLGSSDASGTPLDPDHPWHT